MQRVEHRLESTEWYNRGWHRGNYASAYETEDVTHAIDFATRAEDIRQLPHRDKLAYVAGLVCGFFSSYAWSEIPPMVLHLRHAAGRYAHLTALDRIVDAPPMPHGMKSMTVQRAAETLERFMKRSSPDEGGER